MVVIGMVLGGVLKGQALLRSARLSDTQRALVSVESAVQVYFMAHGAYPGLDSDGLDNQAFWADLHGADVVRGIRLDAGDHHLPTPVGAALRVVMTQDDRHQGWLTTDAVLTPTQARLLDERLDDGTPDAGALQAADGCRSGGAYLGEDGTARCRIYYNLHLPVTGDA